MIQVCVEKEKFLLSFKHAAVQLDVMIMMSDDPTLKKSLVIPYFSDLILNFRFLIYARLSLVVASYHRGNGLDVRIVLAGCFF